ncbi:MAG: toll/interleukin-1 receptor domain-containing protein [Bryobacteraceae bacterium]
MPYVPGFSNDLFISYASADNVDGWVQRFQDQLTKEVARLLGYPALAKAVYLDKIRLQVGQSYPETLDKAARESAVLVTLVSPSYVNSDWCSRERLAFQQKLTPHASFAESLVVCRIRPTEDLPQQLASAQFADFVKPGTEEPWPTECEPWINATNHLAVEIKHMLQVLRQRAGRVFVGRTLNSHMGLRDDIENYLSERSFRATPANAMLDDRGACQGELKEAVCALHFIGNSSEESLARIEDSVKCCPGPTVLFQPFGTELSAEEELLLDNLPQDRYPQKVGPTNDTELKKLLEELLTRRPQSSVPVAASLALVCELSDIPWAQKFPAGGLSVDYPRFLEENLSFQEQIEKWREMLRSSDGLVFYLGRSREGTLRSLAKLADQLNSKALRRWYLADPDLDIKRKSRAADPVYPEGLEDFIQSVRAQAAKARQAMGTDLKVVQG